MNGVLLIPCVGPMQSWGTRSRFQERDTEREPSKSGIIGMLCAALGRDRNSRVDDLASLRMGVRADREGILRRDFQTAQNVAVASGGPPEDLLSHRYYLADGAFLVGFWGEVGLLSDLHAALGSPRWPLYLGRKSYVPSMPPFLQDGVVKNGELKATLLGYPLLVSGKEISGSRKNSEQGMNNGRIRLLLESAEPSHETRRDQPVGFAFHERLFRERFVVTEFIDLNVFVVKGEE
jgi:CRISPR system Cascade subunit CasD